MPDHPRLKTALARQEEKVTTVRAKLEARRQRDSDRARRDRRGNGWRVGHAPTHNDAARMVAEIARTLGARRVVRSDHDVFRAADVDSPLRQIGAATVVLTSGRGRRRESLQRMAMEADLGITGVDYAIAETGAA